MMATAKIHQPEQADVRQEEQMQRNTPLAEHRTAGQGASLYSNSAIT